MNSRYNCISASDSARQLKSKLRQHSIKKLRDESMGGPMHGFQSCEYRYIIIFFLQVIVNFIVFVVDNRHLIQNCYKFRLFYLLCSRNCFGFNLMSLFVLLMTTTPCCNELLSPFIPNCDNSMQLTFFSYRKMCQ